MKAGRTASVVVPAKTLTRLVLYRLLLEELQAKGKTNIFSNEMSDIAGNTAAQVRRDLMAVGYSGSTRHGYCIAELLKAVRSLLEPPEGVTLAIAGVGNLGRALLGYFSLRAPLFRIVAAFDSDENKVGRTIAGYHIHHMRDMADELVRSPAQLGVITVPADQAQKIADGFVRANVKGIVNFAPMPLRVPPDVWIEDMHITATFEKVAYFSRMKLKGETL